MQQTQGGFTLIELLIVVIILGVLSGLAVPQLAGRTQQARIQAARTDILGNIALAIDLYEADTGTYPAAMAELVQNDRDQRGWSGPYLKRGLPRDPWGNDYKYLMPGVWNATAYDLSSAGPDGKHGTADDIDNRYEEA